MWFLIAIVGYIFLAVVFILDKLIVSKSVQSPIIYAFYSTIFLLAAFFVLPFLPAPWLSNIDFLWALISGLGFGLGLWTLYKAVSVSEASHINPFNGAIVTIFIFFFASIFLGEKLSSVQTAGIIILTLASLLLSFEKSHQHNGFHVGFVWAIGSGLFFALSHISAKYLYGIYPFWTAFIWTKATAGILGLILLAHPLVHRQLAKKKKIEKKDFAKRHSLFLIIVDKILGILGVILIQYSISIGSVTLVNALSGLQYVLMFILIYLLTKFLPKFFKEYFTKRELAVEMIAIILVALGSVFFVL